MHWWLWAIIWVTLLSGLCCVLLFSGYRLLRQAARVLKQFEKLFDGFSFAHKSLEPLPENATQNAILLGYPTAARRRRIQKHRNAERADFRRQQRCQRAKILIRTDPTRRTWPDVW